MLPTKVRYSLTRSDLFRARVRSLFQNRTIQIVYCGLGAFIFWQTFSGEPAKFPLVAKIIVAGLTAAMVAALGLATTMVALLAGTFRKNTGILGEHEIEIRDEGLFERTMANETVHRWLAFHKVFVTRRYLYIYVTDTQAHSIPLRCFSSPEHIEAFRSELERMVTAAKSNAF